VGANPAPCRNPAIRQSGNPATGAIFPFCFPFAKLRDILAEQKRKARVEVWAYCLAPNHVCVISMPATALGRLRSHDEGG